MNRLEVVRAALWCIRSAADMGLAALVEIAEAEAVPVESPDVDEGPLARAVFGDKRNGRHTGKE